MSQDNSPATREPETARSGIWGVVVGIGIALLIGAAIVAFVLNMPERRLARASAKFDSLIRTAPADAFAQTALQEAQFDYMHQHNPKTNRQELRAYLGKSLPQKLWAEFQKLLSFNPARAPEIGRIQFYDGRFEESTNATTREKLTSASLPQK